MNRLACFAVGCALCLLLIGSAVGAEEVLENAYVRVALDPSQGGTITSMVYKKCTAPPLAMEHGAGLAASGSLFAGRIRVGENWVESAQVPMQAARETGKEGEVALTLTGRLPESAGGLTWKRTLRMAVEESGFRLADEFSNDGAAAKDLTVLVGQRSRQIPLEWRKNLRCWFGDSKQWFANVAPIQAGTVKTFTADGKGIFWRAVGQFGDGFLYTATLPDKGAAVRHVLPVEQGSPAEFEWTSGEIKLAAKAGVAISGAVMIDEDGRQGNDPSGLAGAERRIITVDVRAAGMPGQTIPGAVTLVSAEPAKLKTTVKQYRLEADKRVDEKVLAEFTDALSPGAAQYHHVDVRPTAKGVLHVEAVSVDEKGRAMTSLARSLIDGEGADGEWAQVWQMYKRKMPEQVIRKGTWEQIGSEEAVSLRPLPAATDDGRRYLAFLEEHFPYQARYLKGAAGKLQIDPARLAYAPQAEVAPAGVACMDLFFNGPDGPINAFSKERSGINFTGLTYVKYLPDKGYRFHIYMGSYGVNSEGLSVSGATLNCDGKTSQYGKQKADEWKKAGKAFAPGWPMMLATCKDLDEALAYVDNPKAPFNAEGNYLLVDRAGNAARVESAGIVHRVYRYDPKAQGFLVAGNYSHVDKEGLFAPGDWGWASNTMMRERFIWKVAGEKSGNISLNDATWIMETHAAGGMCQHGYDNTGFLFTSTSFLAVCKTGDLWLAHGWPCRVQYVRYTLADE